MGRNYKILGLNSNIHFAIDVYVSPAGADIYHKLIFWQRCFNCPSQEGMITVQ